jgi:hypothetical protein
VTAPATTVCKDRAVPCALLLVFRKTEKKERSVGHFDKESNITEKKILFSTRTSEDITIKYLRCIRRVAKKATISFVVCACQFARPHETILFPADKISNTLY